MGAEVTFGWAPRSRTASHSRRGHADEILHFCGYSACPFFIYPLPGNGTGDARWSHLLNCLEHGPYRFVANVFSAS